jgi:hypothetical protein
MNPKKPTTHALMLERAEKTLDREIVSPTARFGKTADVKRSKWPHVYDHIRKILSKPPAAVDTTETVEFKRKFGNTKVVDEAGEPLVVLHATPRDFDEFRAGSSEAAFGSAIHFTDSVDDVNENYARVEGPDIALRVESEVDRMGAMGWLEVSDEEVLDAARRYRDMYDFESDFWIDEAIEKGDVDNLKDELGPELIEQIARKNVLGDENFSVMPVYLNIENPVYLDPSGTKGRTTFDLEYEYDEDGNIVDERGSVIDLLEAIDGVAADDYGSTDSFPATAPQNLKTFIIENALDGELDAFDLVKESKLAINDYYIESDTGGVDTDEFMRKVFERMGFDGIIADAYYFFGPKKRPLGLIDRPGMTGVTPGTYHYMAFKPEQVKSATGNIGTYDQSANILKGIGIGAAALPAAGALMADDDDDLLQSSMRE